MFQMQFAAAHVLLVATAQMRETALFACQERASTDALMVTATRPRFLFVAAPAPPLSSAPTLATATSASPAPVSTGAPTEIVMSKMSFSESAS